MRKRPYTRAFVLLAMGATFLFVHRAFALGDGHLDALISQVDQAKLASGLQAMYCNSHVPGHRYVKYIPLFTLPTPDFDPAQFKNERAMAEAYGVALANQDPATYKDLKTALAWIGGADSSTGRLNFRFWTGEDGVAPWLQNNQNDCRPLTVANLSYELEQATDGTYSLRISHAFVDDEYFHSQDLRLNDKAQLRVDLANRFAVINGFLKVHNLNDAKDMATFSSFLDQFAKNTRIQYGALNRIMRGQESGLQEVDVAPKGHENWVPSLVAPTN